MDANAAGGTQDNGPNLFRPDDIITPSRPAVELPAERTGEPSEQSPAPQAPAEAADESHREAPSEPTPQPAADAPEPSGQAVPAETYGAHYSEPTVTWTASEYITHQKTLGWYALLALAAAALAAIAWLVTRDVFATVTVLVGLLLLAVYASRKPREQSYRLDGAGITIGNRVYGYQEFRSFAIVPEGAFLSVEFTPLKRFAMYTTIYFDPRDADRIVDVLSQFLPMDEPHANLADSLMRRIHF